MDKKKLILMNLPYILAGYFCDKIAWLWRVSPGSNASDKMMAAMNGLNDLFSNPLPSFFPKESSQSMQETKTFLLSVVPAPARLAFL